MTTPAALHSAAEQPDALDPRTARLLPWLVATAFFMEMLDSTILNTALPAIAASLNESPLRLHYVVIAYTLTVALFIPASGWIADRFGTRRVFFTAVLLFTTGSLFCVLAPTLNMLVASRVLQGLGGAIMVPVGRLIVLRVFPREKLLQVLSFVTIPGLIGPLLGPTLGGLLVQYASWHWIFLINIPVGILGCYATLRLMPDRYGTVASRFDLKGFLLVSGSMVMLSVGIEGIGELHLRHAEVLLLLAVGMVMMIGYWLRAASVENPLFTPKLFGTPTFAVGILGNLVSRFASGAMPFLTPLLLQVGLGVSPLKSGLSMIPLAMGAMFSKYMVRRLVPALGYRRLILGNTMFLGAMIMSMSQVSLHTPYGLILLLLAVIGASNSLHFTAMNTMTLLDLSPAHASSGNAMLSVVMQLSISMGVALAAALLTGFETRYGGSIGTDGILQAFSATYICVGAIAMLSSVIFFFVPKAAGLPSAGADTREL